MFSTVLPVQVGWALGEVGAYNSPDSHYTVKSGLNGSQLLTYPNYSDGTKVLQASAFITQERLNNAQWKFCHI